MFISKVKNYILENELIKQKDQVVVALSGGADSVCLLISLLRLKEEMDFEVRAMHINHMIRGEEADADEAFAKNLCEKYGIEFKSVHVDVPALAKAEGLSEEESGRKVRYEELRKFAAGDKIAVAHNKNDQVETILFNIIRGTSLKGLSGMKPLSEDIIRPLLGVSREEIEEFLSSVGQDYRTDSTNLSNDYTRNKIRNKLIPMIEEEINPAFGERLLALSRQAAEARACIEGGEDLALAKQKVYDSICLVAGKKKDIEEKHVNIVLDLFGKEVGKSVNLPYGLVAKTDYDGNVVIKKDAVDEGAEEREATVISRLNAALKFAPIEAYNGQEIPTNTYKKWFDYDKIKRPMSWRFRSSEDVISLDKVGKKKLKDFMIDLKIPQEERDHIPVLCDGNNVVWIPGYRMSADYKISDETKTYIEIDLEI